MRFWTEIVVVICVVALTLVLVPAVVAVRRAAERAGRVLGILEQELRPLVGQVHALAEDLRALSAEAKDGLERVGVVTERVNDAALGLGRIVNVLGSLTRAGQLLGVAAGVKKGIDVFVHRLRKGQGDNHE